MDVLIVDDEAGIRKVVGFTLEDMGYMVHQAASGDEALAVFARVHPPVVLTDIRMPGMDGLELLRRIKELSPDTEVILVTGHGDLEMAVAGLKLDACDFIAKPVGPDVLEIALNRASAKITMRARLKNYTENLEVMVNQQAEHLMDVERQCAVKGAVEGLTQLIGGVTGDVEGGVGIFNGLPCLVSIQDGYQRIVSVNPLYRASATSSCSTRLPASFPCWTGICASRPPTATSRPSSARAPAGCAMRPAAAPGGPASAAPPSRALRTASRTRANSRCAERMAVR